MDESTGVAQKTEAEAIESLEGDYNGRRTPVKVANCAGIDEANLTKTPKRKLSVFYRSFDVIASKNQGEIVDFRRTSSSPSVRDERTEESRSEEISQQTSPCKKGLVNNYRLLIESGKFLNSPSTDCSASEQFFPTSNAQFSPTGASSSTVFKLSQVQEDKSVDNFATITETSIRKYFKLSSSGSGEFQDASSKSNDSRYLTIVESSTGEKLDNDRTFHRTLHEAHPVSSNVISCSDLVKIKDSVHPRSLVNASSSVRNRKLVSVDPEMSSHEDSWIGSDSEEDSISFVRDDVDKSDKSKSYVSSRPSSSFSIGESSTKPNSSETCDAKRSEDLVELHSRREERQRCFAAKRSLSEGDNERYQFIRRRCECINRKESSTEEEQPEAFPSFADFQLRTTGLSSSEDTDALYRGNMPENELERKYIAFSVCLGTDRITLHRRVSLSRRNRDLAERNLASEIEQMHENIEELSPLCTDSESIEKVERVRHRLDTVMRCVHKVSSAAETLGAMCQEQRISKAIFLADKYLEKLRSRCENLASEIAEAKRILLENNIMIEENSGEGGEDLLKIRYKNGVASNNRTMITRRRASIATISRPLTSQDIVKEGPRQRNSVCGKITVRRPSLCSEVQRWEHEKPNRTDSFNSVAELRDIFEQTESRRNSAEENNNLLRDDQSNNDDSVNRDVANKTEEEGLLSNRQNFFLESNVTRNVERQLKLCTRTAESLGIFRNFKVWQQVLRWVLIFFLGFYAKYILSSTNTCGNSSKLSLE